MGYLRGKISVVALTQISSLLHKKNSLDPYSHKLNFLLLIFLPFQNAEQKVSPAQDAVMRVQYRIAEIGFEPGSAVVARLYVPSHQVRYLLGKGGCIINEMRRATPCSIRVFPRDQAPKFASHNDEVVQVTLTLLFGLLKVVM